MAADDPLRPVMAHTHLEDKQRSTYVPYEFLALHLRVPLVDVDKIDKSQLSAQHLAMLERVIVYSN